VFQFVTVGTAGKNWRKIREGRDWPTLERGKRSRWDVALKLNSVSLNDFTIKICVAKGAAYRLARDGADH